jgi:hypothetical protein
MLTPNQRLFHQHHHSALRLSNLFYDNSIHSYLFEYLFMPSYVRFEKINITNSQLRFLQ